MHGLITYTSSARTPMQRLSRHRNPVAVALALVACSPACSTEPLSAVDGLGPHPVLPAPDHALIPTVNVAAAVGWPKGSQPQAGPGMTVNAFAGGLDHPRWLYVLPNGDVLVAETNAPPQPADSTGIKNRVMRLFMKRAGAGTPSANRITLLRDTDGDGVADVRSALLEGLHSPFGMALVGSDFYVADTDAVLRFPYQTGQQQIAATGAQVAALPAGPRNHHWTKGLIASLDGRKLYATVGSNSNVAEHGMAFEAGRAAIWEIDARSGDHRVFATGLRNANGLAWEPESGALWTTVNERDELGDDLVPDYMTAVHDGAFYGWPYSYYGQHVDTRVTPQRPDLVAARDRARLCPGRAYGVARPGAVDSQRATRPVPARHVHRAAWLVEPAATQRLQSDLRAVRRWPAGRPAARRAGGLRR